jgi:flagellar hook-associated protein 2
VTVSTERDLDQASEAVKAVVDALSAALATINKETKTASEDSSAAGPLSSDTTARNLKLSLRSYLSGAVSGLTGDYTTGSSVGISLTREGDVTLDSAKLKDALAADFGAVASLFTSSYRTSDSRVGVVSAPENLPGGTYSVVATQALSPAEVMGITYTKPNPAETFQITVGGTTVDVTVPKNAFINEAVDAINADLLAGGITNVVASQANVGGNDVLVLTGSDVGSSASFVVSANTFGLAGTHLGLDVGGTIDGVAGTGSGSQLSAASPLSGLVLSLDVTDSEISGAGGSLDVGTVTISTGLAGAFGEFLDTVTETGGLIDRATDRWDAQIKLADERIEQLESRLELREITLRRQFSALESTLAQLQGVASQLAAGVQSLGGLQT